MAGGCTQEEYKNKGEIEERCWGWRGIVDLHIKWAKNKSINNRRKASIRKKCNN